MLKNKFKIRKIKNIFILIKSNNDRKICSINCR